jgi:hypothetical protein
MIPQGLAVVKSFFSILSNFSFKNFGAAMSTLKGLLQSGVGGLSLGRVSFWIVFALAAWAWAHGRDIPNGQLITLLSCLGYLLGGKFRGVAKMDGVTFDGPDGGKGDGK